MTNSILLYTKCVLLLQKQPNNEWRTGGSKHQLKGQPNMSQVIIKTYHFKSTQCVTGKT